MILPLVIIVLILVCAYLEYQKNINMNNKVVICIICILTFVLCMGFVEKYRNREEGFENNNELYTDNTLESADVKEKCDAKEKNLYPKKKPMLYDTITTNIKDDIRERNLLKNYITRLDKGEKVCWKLPNYQECRALETKLKLEGDLTVEDTKIIETVCESEKNCIEKNMINEYDDILKDYDIEGGEQIKNKAQKLSIKLTDGQGKDKDDETLMNDIRKTIIRNILNDITNGKVSSSKMKEYVEDLIIKNKLKLCSDCSLDNDICKKLGEEKENRAKIEEEKRREVAAKEAAAAKAAAEKAKLEKAQRDALAKERAAKAKAEAEAEALRQKLEQAQQDKVNSELNSSSVSDLLGGNSETTTSNSTSGTTTGSTTYGSGNNNPSIENKLEARKQQRGQIYVNPMSSGHMTDKYYSSLDNKPPGYSYIDPRLWTVPQKRPPVCHYNNDLSAVPLYDSGTHINVLELTQYGDIATSERDVRQTNIGSILPQFQYREFS